MAMAGFCSACGENVWLTESGGCTRGHSPDQIINAYEADVAPPVTEPELAAAAVPEAAAVPSSGPMMPAELGARKRFLTSPIVIIGGVAALLLVVVLAVVFFPRPKIAVTGFTVPESVLSGEDIVATVEIANTGWAKGDYPLTILMDGATVNGQSVSVAARSQKRVEVTIPAGGISGSYDISVAGWDGPGDTVWVMAPAEFVVDWLEVTPDPLDVNTSSQATAEVSVSNIGDVEGDYVISLTVDGAVVEERTIHLEAESTAEELFTFAVSGPGSHEVAAADQVATLDAHQILRPDNGTVLINQLSGGSNVFTVVNNSEDDVFVVISQPGEAQPALLAVYVTAQNATSVRGVRDTTYVCYYMEGAGWCGHCQRFTEAFDYGRFDATGELKSGGGMYTESVVTFGIKEGDGTPTESVGEEDFPTM
ncbi:MAG: hypothetical protein Q7W51_05180 [Coriobacteriia bacterium]|nr:hypothetical protein [Coriobacteriia bacterium]